MVSSPSTIQKSGVGFDVSMSDDGLIGRSSFAARVFTTTDVS